MTKTVLHIVYSLGIGGLEQVIVNLVNNTHSKGVKHIVVSLTSEQTLAKALPADTQVYCLNKSEGNDLKSHVRLFRLLKRINPDVLHSYNFGTIEYQFTAWLAGVPTRIHAEHGRESSDPDGNNKKHNLFRYLISWILTSFVVVSTDLLEWTKKAVGVNQNKLHLIFNGVNVPCDDRRTAIAKKETVICTVGRLSEIKNQKFLLRAYAQFYKNSIIAEKCKLWIIGDGPLKAKLINLAAQLGIKEQVVFWGARSDVSFLLHQVSLFVLSSLYEAMPMTILEAMSVGCPVLSTNVGGVGYIIKDGFNGLLVEPNDTTTLALLINKLVTHPVLMETLGKNGKTTVKEKYSMDAMGQNYLKLYGVI